jgi:hypothetical protein
LRIDTLKHNQVDGHSSITSTVEECWDNRLTNAIFAKAKDETLKPECMGCLLADLLDRGVGEARVFAESLIPLPPPANCKPRAQAVSELRLVQSGDQLLEVVIESLKRLEATLQGETPAAQFLWDKTNENGWRPKDENSLSDYVKIHLDKDLRQRGVIVNREVEIRHGHGERTDIHVDAIIRGPGKEC